jgi:hypothetical protein
MSQTRRPVHTPLPRVVRVGSDEEIGGMLGAEPRR